MKLFLVLTLLTSGALAMKNTPRKFNRQKVVTTTVEECMQDKSTFRACQEKFSPSERAKFCGNHKLAEEIGGPSIGSVMTVISEVCLGKAKY